MKKKHRTATRKLFNILAIHSWAKGSVVHTFSYLNYCVSSLKRFSLLPMFIILLVSCFSFLVYASLCFCMHLSFAAALCGLACLLLAASCSLLTAHLGSSLIYILCWLSGVQSGAEQCSTMYDVYMYIIYMKVRMLYLVTFLVVTHIHTSTSIRSGCAESVWCS